MKFSKKWLQDYIDIDFGNEVLVSHAFSDRLVVETLNRKAFEVEEVVQLPNDTIFDIKVLPNRAHDALGHHGMAYELCASLGLTFKKEKEVVEDISFLDPVILSPLVSIEDEVACTRFMSMRIDGVKVGESPVWLKERLEAIGQRSINNIVDITNYVQYSLNKPMHAYDARTIKGALTARFAKSGEQLTTLDDKELKLDEKTLVIADDEKVLGLAGIKGGKYSGIQNDTTSVVLESANFEPTLIRKTSEKYNIRTDASKRFENGIANNLVVEGLHMTANLIKEICGNVKRSEAVDVYPKKDVPYYVGISKRELNDILGTSYDDAVIKKTLNQLSFTFEEIVPSKYIVATYPALIGAGYKWDASMRYDAPAIFSCSSLISYLYKGVWMPSVSIDKYVFSKKVSKEDLRFGDMIFSNSNEGAVRFETVAFLRGTKVEEGVDHVALYLGNGKVLHASKVQGLVCEESLDTHLASRKVVGYGRAVEDMDEVRYVVRVPSVRLDIRIKEDLAEEVGRIIGYNFLTPVLPQLHGVIGLANKRLHYENKVRDILFTNGFSEIMTYTFGDHGEVRLKKGLADDKELLRSDLETGMKTAFALNLHNAPLFGEKVIRTFEFGNIFKNGKEERHFCLAIDDGAKKSSYSEDIDMIFAQIKRELMIDDFSYDTVSTKPYIVEVDFDTLITRLSEPSSYEPLSQTTGITAYKTVSPYPHIVRDIAVWVPSTVTWENLLEVISGHRDSLVLRVDLFDTFTKTFEDGSQKTSYAFRLVIQSHEKTLTDEEANLVADKVYSAFKEKGWEIR
ncbi:MAG: C40 family peptidase [Candidatus Pacebacteria bacterium]|nr:C40 family peptidase [Candidatus Paceibacterota bacterium]